MTLRSMNEKGSAEAATSPSHGPAIPNKENVMNGGDDSTDAAASATAEGRVFGLNRADMPLRSMPIMDLMAVYLGLSKAIDGILGVQVRPRTSGLGYDMLAEEIERLECLRGWAIEELEVRPSDSSWESQERIRIIASYDLAECGKGIVETIEKMARLYAQGGLAR